MSGWRKVHLYKVAEIERNSIDPSAISDGTTYIGLENIETGGKFANVRSVSTGELASNKFVFTDKHVLYGKLRPYLAKVARPSFEGICSTDILPILPGEELDRDYLTHFLLQPSMIEMATSRSTGANLPRLSPKALAEFLIPLPPIAEQRRIAAILDKAEELRELRRQALRELDAIAQSIFIEMFGGGRDNKSSGKLQLSDGKFERGMADKLFVPSPLMLTPIEEILIGHDNSGVGPGWFLDRVEIECPVTGMVQTFACGKWFAKDEGDGRIERILKENTSLRNENKKAQSVWNVWVYTSDMKGKSP